MAIEDEALGYEHHEARYASMDLLTGDSNKDAHWHRDAEHMHALSVCDAIRDAHTSAVILAGDVTSAEAQMQLKYGVARRTKFIWLSLRQLVGLIPPDHTEPLPSDQVEEAAQALNGIYINIRGALDNFAWCLRDLCGSDRTRRLPPMRIHLFGDDFLRDPELREVAELVAGFAEWGRDLKDRRDPAAHRIPLSVPPAVLDKTAEEEYTRLSAEYSDALKAATAIGEGDDSSAMFEKVDVLHDRLRRVGTFFPLFVHHPNDGATSIYPTVPQDVGQLVKIARGLTTIISDKLAA